MLEILPGIKIFKKSLWIEKEKTLVISDLHIGYEESLCKQGILIPRMQLEDIKKELTEILDKFDPKTIIINGDLKHEFGEISKQEWFDTFKILDLLLERSKVILIKGNHDTILEPIAKKKGLEIQDYFSTGKSCILHGHMKINNLEIQNCDTLIIGHDHPAISLKEGIKSETYKCFLLGKYKEKNLIVLPSFFSLVEGTDIKKERTLSPYLNQELNNFKVYIIGDKEYFFGKVKDI